AAVIVLVTGMTDGSERRNARRQSVLAQPVTSPLGAGRADRSGLPSARKVRDTARCWPGADRPGRLSWRGRRVSVRTRIAVVPLPVLAIAAGLSTPTAGKAHPAPTPAPRAQLSAEVTGVRA